MVAQFVSDLHLPLSEVRLESYRPTNGSDLEMVTNYFWDIELAKALMPSLHGVELALRNSVHTALTDMFNDEMWFYLPGILEPGQMGELSRALGQLAQKKSNPTAGRIVAELTFGFWVTLASSPYEQRLWQPNGFALLNVVFRNVSGLSRKQIHKRYNDIRLNLRNRVSHHEAIYDRPNLLQDHADIHEAIAWISPSFQQAIYTVDDFPAVLRNGKGSVEQKLKAYHSIP